MMTNMMLGLFNVHEGRHAISTLGLIPQIGKGQCCHLFVIMLSIAIFWPTPCPRVMMSFMNCPFNNRNGMSMMIYKNTLERNFWWILYFLARKSSGNGSVPQSILERINLKKNGLISCVCGACITSQFGVHHCIALWLPQALNQALRRQCTWLVS